MIALAVDDEKPMLEALIRAVEASPDVTEVNAFGTCSQALEWASVHPADLAFLDISMRGMGGMALAEKSNVQALWVNASGEEFMTSRFAEMIRT